MLKSRSQSVEQGSVPVSPTPLLASRKVDVERG